MILDEIKEYAEKCINDKIPSCQKHKWACKRFLDDVKKSKEDDFLYEWNEAEAQNIVDWFALLKHSKGILAGKPIELTDWQKFRICQLYGWREKKTGYKRFRRAYMQVARKNAKSQEEAGIALYELAVQSTKHGEVYEIYTAGVKRDQSKIITNECALMLRGSVLAEKFRVRRNRGEADLITHTKTNSVLRALCAEDGKKGDGSNPALLILDEMHQHKTMEFYDLFKGSNTKEGMMIIITTAGVDLTYPCYTQIYEYCSKLLDPDNTSVVNEQYFVDINEVEKGDDISDREVWKKANPIRMSYPEGVRNIEAEYATASVIPEEMFSFKTKCLNMWVTAPIGRYMDIEKWRKCEVEEFDIDLKNKPVYIGVDLSSKIDLTSLAFIIPISKGENRKYYLYSHSFAPNLEILTERMQRDNVPYLAWKDEGFVSITNSQIVDQQYVMDWAMNFCKKHGLKIQCWAIDPANAGKFMTDLDALGETVEEVYQSNRSLNESTNGFREQVYEGNVVYKKNPVLTFAMSNAILKSSNGLIKIDKDANSKKIDPVDATLCAFKLALYHEFDKVSGFELAHSFLKGLR